MRRFMSSEMTRDVGRFWKYPDVKKWIADAIEGEEIKPERQLWKMAPTADRAVDLRKSAIRRFRRKKHNPEAAAIIERLANCSRERRCYSGVCPECGRLFQRAFVRAVRRYIRNIGGDQHSELVAITIIPADVRVSPGELCDFDIQNFIRRIKEKLKCTNLAIGIGAVDFSFNEDQDGRYEAHWCPHAHIVGWTCDVAQLRIELKRHFPRKGIVIQRPTKVRKCDGTEYAVSYQCKIEFKRRVTYYHEKRGCRDTAYPRLKSAQKVELARYLNKAGLESRLILLRLKAYVSRGKLRLKRVAP